MEKSIAVGAVLLVGHFRRWQVRLATSAFTVTSSDVTARSTPMVRPPAVCRTRKTVAVRRSSRGARAGRRSTAGHFAPTGLRPPPDVSPRNRRSVPRAACRTGGPSGAQRRDSRSAGLSGHRASAGSRPTARMRQQVVATTGFVAVDEPIAGKSPHSIQHRAQL